MKIEFESFEDMKKFLDDLGYDIQPKGKRSMSNAEKQKAYRERKKVTNGNDTVTDVTECVEEEREEKEEDSPLLPPFPSSPNTLLSYSPYNPPFPEEREEREEDIFAGLPEKRGEMKSFGPHVRLSDVEFLKLQEKFGYDETMQMIERMNAYIGEDKKRIKKYETRNHYLTLLNWKRRDEEKKQQKKTFSFSEVGDMMRRGEL